MPAVCVFSASIKMAPRSVSNLSCLVWPCVHTCRARDKGLRTAALIRFIGQEDGLLSHTHDGPRMYINLEGAWLHSRQPPGRKTLCMQRSNLPRHPFTAKAPPSSTLGCPLRKGFNISSAVALGGFVCEGGAGAVALARLLAQGQF